MDTAGVDGEVIAQQLYSRETGRGTIDGHRVTVATFDDNANRDQWADAARDLGQTVRVGELWAAAASDAAGPDLFAERVGDQGV